MFEEVDLTRLSRNFLEIPWKPRKDVPIESDFRYMYEELNLPGEDICKFFGFSQPALSRAIRKFKLHKSREKINESRKSCFTKRFGSPSPLGNKEIRARRDSTCIERYGTINPITIPEIQEKKKKTSQERYGGNSPMCSEDVRNKSRKTSKEKYGTEYASQSKEVKEKICKTNMEKYGVKCVFQSEQIKDKIADSNLKKYGCENASQSPLIQAKVAHTIKKHYGVTRVFQVPSIKEKIRKTNLKKYGVACVSQKNIKHRRNLNKEYWEQHFIDGHQRFCVSDCATYHNIHNSTVRTYKEKFGIPNPYKYESQGEIDLIRYCASLGFKGKKDRTILDGKEIDVYLPDVHLGIEYNGLLYHATDNINVYTKVPVTEYYHFDKTFACWNKGVTLLHIMESEWLTSTKRNVWRGIIKEKLGLTKQLSGELVTISEDTANSFFDTYTLRHSSTGKYNYAIQQNKRTLAVVRAELLEDGLCITDVGTLTGYSRVDAINFVRQREPLLSGAHLLVDNRYYNPNEFNNTIIIRFVPPSFLYIHNSDVANHKVTHTSWGTSNYKDVKYKDCLIIHDAGCTVLEFV